MLVVILLSHYFSTQMQCNIGGCVSKNVPTKEEKRPKMRHKKLGSQNPSLYISFCSLGLLAILQLSLNNYKIKRKINKWILHFESLPTFAFMPLDFPKLHFRPNRTQNSNWLWISFSMNFGCSKALLATTPLFCIKAPFGPSHVSRMHNLCPFSS